MLTGAAGIKISNTFKREEFNKFYENKNLSWNLLIQEVCTKLRPMLGMLFRCLSIYLKVWLLIIYSLFINSEITWVTQVEYDEPKWFITDMNS